MMAGQTFNPSYKSCGFYPDEIVHRIPQKDLGDGPKLLYTRMQRWAGAKGACWYSYETMAEELGKCARQVQKDIKALENYKLIAHEVRGWKNGKRQSNIYHFLWHPIFDGSSKVGGTSVHSSRESCRNSSSLNSEKSCRNSKVKLVEQNGQSWWNSSSKESSSESLRESLSSENQKPKPNFDDDEKPKPSARPQLSDPKDEFRERMRERHGDSFDVSATLRHIQKQLGDGEIGLDKFLEADRERTTAPADLTNPPGYYRQLATDLVREKGAAKVEAAVETSLRAKQALTIKDDWQPPTCCSEGKLDGGAYCSCAVGKAAEEFAAYRAKRTN
jgi:Helix-turn-helix domain